MIRARWWCSCELMMQNLKQWRGWCHLRSVKKYLRDDDATRWSKSKTSMKQCKMMRIDGDASIKKYRNRWCLVVRKSVWDDDRACEKVCGMMIEPVKKWTEMDDEDCKKETKMMMETKKKTIQRWWYRLRKSCRKMLMLAGGIISFTKRWCKSALKMQISKKSEQ